MLYRSLILLLLCGCAHHHETHDEVKTYATPDCTRLKEDCEIKDGKLAKGCKFDVACYKVVHQKDSK